MPKMENVSTKSEKGYMKWFANPLFVCLLCILLLVLPLVLRNFLAFGDDFYLYKRISHIRVDELSYGGRDYLYNTGNVFVFSLIDSYYLSIILGVISLLLFYGILKKFNADRDAMIISCFLLIISQTFLYLFSSFRGLTVPIFLTLLGSYIIIQKKFYWISFFIFPLIPFFGITPSIAVLILLSVYCLKFKRYRDFLIVFFLMLTVLLYIYAPVLKDYGMPRELNFKTSAFREVVFDFGGNYGISIFVLLLMFIGLLNLWEKKYQNIGLYALFFIFVILLFFSLDFIFYFNFLTVFLAALGINKIIKKKWESNLVRNLTLIFSIFGLIFSSFTFIMGEVNAEPSEDLVKSLDFLDRNTDQDSIILSHYKYGVFINSIANRKNVMDTNFLYAPNVNERYQDLNFLFYTRDLDKTLDILKKYNIKYILITNEMKEGLVWTKSNEGLLYLLVNNPKVFNKAYNNDKIEIWEIKELE